jgi:hypothetical protein
VSLLEVQFFDAATLQQTGEIDMPGSTNEMVLIAYS